MEVDMEELVVAVREFVAGIKAIAVNSKEGKPYDDLKETTEKMLLKFFQLCKSIAPQIEQTVKPAWESFLDTAKQALHTKQSNDEKKYQQSLTKMDQSLNTLATIIKKFVLSQRDANKNEDKRKYTMPNIKVSQPKEPPSNSQNNGGPNAFFRTSYKEEKQLGNRKSIVISDSMDIEHNKEDLSLFLGFRPSREELVKRNILVATSPSTPARVRQSSSSSSLKPPPPIPPNINSNNGRSSVDEDEDEEKETIFPLETKVRVLSGEISCLPGEEIISKIENVQMRGKNGKLFLTNYQLHFVHDSKNIFLVPVMMVLSAEKVGGGKTSAISSAVTGESKELQNKINLTCKDSRNVVFCFEKSEDRNKVFQMLKYLLLLPTHKLFAFSYKPSFVFDGWATFSMDKEYNRMGVPTSNVWRISNANLKYKLCSSYPSVIAVPNKVSDTDLQAIAAYRSKGRLQALSYLHPNTASITRCSQPRVGVTRRRSSEDEKMMNEILHTNKFTTTLHIKDARPRTNARANVAKGAGTELMNNYPNCKLTFEDIGNIHVMRDSLNKFREAITLNEADGDDFKWWSAIESSGWLSHVGRVLASACSVVDLVAEKRFSVLIHCSDGWDRTSQMTSLACLLLDPFYRTIIGFEVLIEKEWCSFGHQFALRSGHDGTQKSHERSPIFVQFIECVYQLTVQYPTYFEFNEKFLVAIADEVYTCRFGTFLYDCERDRTENRLKEKTLSLWSYLNSNISEYQNIFYEQYDSVISAFFSCKKLKVWENLHFRFNPELLPQTSALDKATELIQQYKTKIKQLEMKNK